MLQSISRRFIHSESSRIFAKYTIYKNSGALGISPINPTWKQISDDAYTVSKPGVLLLEFAKSSGEQKYDWNNKQYFALSVGEIGDVVANLSGGKNVSFFHDSAKVGGGGDSGYSGNGKGFNINLSPDGGVWFFTLTDKSQDKWLVPVSMGEFVVMRQIMQAAIPSFLGIDRALQQEKMVDDGVSSSYNNAFGGGGGSYMNSGGDNSRNDSVERNVTGTKTTAGSNWLDQL